MSITAVISLAMGYLLFGAFLYVYQSKFISLLVLIALVPLITFLIYVMGELSHEYLAHLLDFSGRSRWEGSAFPSLIGGFVASLTAVVYFSINEVKK